MIKPILPPDFHNEVNTLLSDISENTIGVYFLTHKDTVVYVGQSIDILNRIQQHRRSDDKIFDSFYYDECSIDELDLIEKDFIESYKPPFNIRDNKDYFIGIEKYCDDCSIEYVKIENIPTTVVVDNKTIVWAVMTAFDLTENKALKKMKYGSIMSAYKELEELTGIKAYLWRDYANKPLSKHMVTAVELVECKRELAKCKEERR